MENLGKKSRAEQFRNSQKPVDFYKYPPVEGFEKPSSQDDLNRIKISKSFMPYSEIPGNDR